MIDRNELTAVMNTLSSLTSRNQSESDGDYQQRLNDGLNAVQKFIKSLEKALMETMPKSTAITPSSLISAFLEQNKHINQAVEGKTLLDLIAEVSKNADKNRLPDEFQWGDAITELAACGAKGPQAKNLCPTEFESGVDVFKSRLAREGKMLDFIQKGMAILPPTIKKEELPAVIKLNKQNTNSVSVEGQIEAKKAEIKAEKKEEKIAKSEKKHEKSSGKKKVEKDASVDELAKLKKDINDFTKNVQVNYSNFTIQNYVALSEVKDQLIKRCLDITLREGVDSKRQRNGLIDDINNIFSIQNEKLPNAMPPLPPVPDAKQQTQQVITPSVPPPPQDAPPPLPPGYDQQSKKQPTANESTNSKRVPVSHQGENDGYNKHKDPTKFFHKVNKAITKLTEKIENKMDKISDQVQKITDNIRKGPKQ